MTQGTTYLEIFNETIEVQADGLLVEVAILFDLKAGVAEDGGMVAPRRSGEVYGFGMGIETTEEGATNAKGSSSRD